MHSKSGGRIVKFYKVANVKTLEIVGTGEITWYTVVNTGFKISKINNIQFAEQTSNYTCLNKVPFFNNVTFSWTTNITLTVFSIAWQDEVGTVTTDGTLEIY